MNKHLKTFYAISKGKREKGDLLLLLKFFAFLIILIFGYTYLFQIIMTRVEGAHHSWVAGFYWVLINMTTLGTGDIYFTSDIGRLFTTVVLLSGVVFLLIILPYAIISLFIFPWMEEMARRSIPTEPPEAMKDHMIICGTDSIAMNLEEKLRLTNRPYIFVEPDPEKVEKLHESDIPVIYGDLASEETYKKLNINDAKIVFANQSDVVNSHIALTVRGISETPIVALAETGASKDILHFAGCNYVLPVKEILGRNIANRCVSGASHTNVMGNLEKLKIVEFPVLGTPFMGKVISEMRIRETTGVNIVGIWERGGFSTPTPDYILTPKSVLLLMGAKDKLTEFNAYMSIYFPSDKPIVIIGAGRVGIYVAHELDKKKIPYTIVDTIDCNEKLEMGRFVKGDAKDRVVLEEAGIMEAPTAVLTTSDDGTNGYLTLYCRALNKKLRIVSRAIFTKNIDTIHKAGADFVVSYSMIGTSIVNNILQKQNLTLLAEGLHIFRHKTPPSLVGQTIAQSKVGSLTGCNIIGINRNDELIDAPHFSTVLGADDVIVMIGNMAQEESFNKAFMT
jgi:Trk K+ transport system NAD-binding subunit